MYIGKFAVISWLFSGTLLFTAYMMETWLPGDVALLDGPSRENLQDLIATSNQLVNSTELNPSQPFTQYTAGAELALSLIDGQLVADSLGLLPMPFSSEPVMWLVMFLFSFSSAMFFLNIITGRDLAITGTAVVGALLAMALLGMPDTVLAGSMYQPI